MSYVCCSAWLYAAHFLFFMIRRLGRKKNMKYKLSMKRIKNKTYKVKKEKDMIAENTAIMSKFSKNIIDIILKS